jgi:hypothetical protein
VIGLMPRSTALEYLPLRPSRLGRRRLPLHSGRRSMGEASTHQPFGYATGILPTERW